MCTVREEQKIALAKRIVLLLTLLLFLKIGGYFTVSESIVLTRSVKILLRMGATGGIIWLYNRLKGKGMSTPVRLSSAWPPMLYGAYLILGFASLLWSTNVGYSLLQWFMTTESLVFVWYFLKVLLMAKENLGQSLVRLSQPISQSIFLVMLIFLVGWLISPDDFYRLTHGGEVARLGGYFMNPNELGMLAVVGMAATYLELAHKRKIMVWVHLLAAIIVLVMTGSRSSMIAALLVTALLTQRFLTPRLKILIYGLMIASLPVIINLIFIKAGDLEEVLSMTGRLPFWKALLSEGLPKEPWLGFGFMRIAYTEAFQSVHTYAGKMTHNTFIQVLMNLGIIGFAIALLQLITTMVAGLRQSDENQRLLFAAVMIPLLVNSFTEFGIFGETNFGILLYQIFIFYPVLCLSPKVDRRSALRKRIARNRWEKSMKYVR